MLTIHPTGPSLGILAQHHHAEWLQTARWSLHAPTFYQWTLAVQDFSLLAHLAIYMSPLGFWDYLTGSKKKKKTDDFEQKDRNTVFQDNLEYMSPSLLSQKLLPFHLKEVKVTYLNWPIFDISESPTPWGWKRHLS